MVEKRSHRMLARLRSKTLVGTGKEEAWLANQSNAILRERTKTKRTRNLSPSLSPVRTTRGILEPTLSTHGCIRRSIQKCGRQGGKSSSVAAAKGELQRTMMRKKISATIFSSRFS